MNELLRQSIAAKSMGVLPPRAQRAVKHACARSGPRTQRFHYSCQPRYVHSRTGRASSPWQKSACIRTPPHPAGLSPRVARRLSENAASPQSFHSVLWDKRLHRTASSHAGLPFRRTASLSCCPQGVRTSLTRRKGSPACGLLSEIRHCSLCVLVPARRVPDS